VGACVGEEMDEDADVYAGMVEVGLCTGAGVVSGAGTSSNETLLLSRLLEWGLWCAVFVRSKVFIV